MELPTTCTLTPARLVALALVAAALGGLAYLRFDPGPGRVSVPEGAKAGELTLEACTYDTEDGPYAADCGTLVVPENRADPASRLIALPVTRIRARSEHPREPIFRLEGGPGVTNMEFDAASRFAGDHDVVLVGYRGVDGSARLDCPEVESALRRTSDVLGEASFRAYEAGFRSCAERLAAEGVDLAGYGLPQQVDDLEAARVALGYDRIDLLSESAGTRTALIYAWRYPRSIRRSVMIGVNPPGHFLWDPQTTDEQLDRYAALCEQEAACRERTRDLAVALDRTSAALPGRWLGLPIDAASARVVSFYALMESSAAAAPASAPMALDAWLSAAAGDPSGLWLASVFGELLFPKLFVWGQYASAGRLDAGAARSYFAGGARPANLGYAASAFAWGGGRMVDAWPAAPDEDAYDRMRPSQVETLLVGGELDFSTPPQVATREVLPYLPNGRQVVLTGFGHTVSFWEEQPEAGAHLIATFLDTGRVDTSRYEPQRVDLAPGLRYTVLAKAVAGGMLAAALLAVVSLLWMWRRVHWAGRFGTAASAVLRSLGATVLGTGGWSFGVLLTQVALPGVHPDDPLLATLGIALPVGLGVYLAWRQRDRPAAEKRLALAAAFAGALTGGWLGFHATPGFLALLTALAGAVAAANLALLLLDCSCVRRDRGEPTAEEAVRLREHAPRAGVR